MNKGLFFAVCVFSIFGSAFYSLTPKVVSTVSSLAGTTLILYDAASGTIPSAPLMNFNDFPPGVALPTYAEGVTMMDTTVSSKDTYAGWVASGAITPGFPILDRTAGFQVNFSIQVENESHSNNHRAGFSMIILSEDARGVELAFWQNEIWVQSDENTGGLFRHGEGVAFATSNGLIDYQVTVLDDSYTLTANMEPILTGPLRDYSNFEGFPDPYQTPNFLFLGDDTTSAEARIRLSLLSATGTQPIVPTATITSTSISSPTPIPTDSPTPAPSATPLPAPTPTSKGFEFCSSSGFLIMVIAIMVIKRTGRVKDPP